MHIVIYFIVSIKYIKYLLFKFSTPEMVEINGGISFFLEAQFPALSIYKLTGHLNHFNCWIPGWLISLQSAIYKACKIKMIICW